MSTCDVLYLQCAKRGCIPASAFCDGVVDCNDESYETNCTYVINRRQNNQFQNEVPVTHLTHHISLSTHLNFTMEGCIRLYVQSSTGSPAQTILRLLAFSEHIYVFMILISETGYYFVIMDIIWRNVICFLVPVCINAFLHIVFLYVLYAIKYGIVH